MRLMNWSRDPRQPCPDLDNIRVGVIGPLLRIESGPVSRGRGCLQVLSLLQLVMPLVESLRAPARNDNWHVLECPAQSPAGRIFGYARPMASRNRPQGSSLAAEQRTQPRWQ
jgi:hypothetical protein